MSIKITPVPSSSGGSSFQYTSTRYLDPVAGNDSTGDGSYSKPWATIGHANSTIVDNGSSKRYVLNLAPGTYTENVALKNYVFLSGQPTAINDINIINLTSVIIVGNITCPDTTSGSFQVSGCTITGDVQTYTTSTTAHGNFIFIGCNIQGATLNIGSSDTTGFPLSFTLQDCICSNIVNIYSSAVEFKSSNVYGSVNIFGGILTTVDSPGIGGITAEDDSASNAPQFNLYGGQSSNPSFIQYNGTNQVSIITDCGFNGNMTLTSSGSFNVIYLDVISGSLSGTGTITPDATFWLVTTGGTNAVVTLPLAGSYSGKPITVVKVDSGVGHVVITRAGSDTLSGATTQTIVSRYSSRTLLSDNSSTWYLTSSVGT